MDKAELIRHEIEKRRVHNLAIGNPLFSTMAEEDIELLCFIDSLQEEPVSEDLEEAAEEYVTKEGYLAGLHYNSMVRSFKAGAKWYASHNTKLPDNLLLAARKASIDMCNIDDKYLDEYHYNPIAEQKFIEGAKWQFYKIKETLLSEVLPCFMHGGEADEVVVKLDEVLNQNEIEL